MKQATPYSKRLGGTFNHCELEKANRIILHAVLATSRNDIPYTSLISYAYDSKERAFLFLTPRKTNKYSNMISNPNVALLIDTRENSQRDYMSGEAYTVLGKAHPLRAGKRRDTLLKTFLAKHPRLKDFSNAKDVALVLVSIGHCFKVGNFQEVHELSDE